MQSSKRVVTTDKCGVCGNDKPWHEPPEVQHEFNIEGQLIKKPKKQTAVPRQGIAGDTVIIRLIGVLASNGTLNEKDLATIFPAAGGSDVSPH